MLNFLKRLNRFANKLTNDYFFIFRKLLWKQLKKYICAHSCKWGDGGHQTKLQTLNLKKLQV